MAVFLSGELKSLAGFSLWGHKEPDMIKRLTLHFIWTEEGFPGGSVIKNPTAMQEMGV